jgi:hypothetical protein
MIYYCLRPLSRAKAGQPPFAAKTRKLLPFPNYPLKSILKCGCPRLVYHGYVPEKLTTQEANVVKKTFDGVVEVSKNGTCKVKC